MALKAQDKYEETEAIHRAGTGVESRVNYTGYSQDRGCSSPTADRPDR